MTVSRRSVLKVLSAGAAGAAAAVAAPAEAREPLKMPADAVGLLYDSTLCIGCRACVTKCKQANELPVSPREFNGAPFDAPSDLDSQTKTVIKAHAEGNKLSFIKRNCMQCVDPACVTACMIKAFQKGPQGIVTYAASRCLGDRYCQVACPFNVPKFEWHKAFPIMVKCEMCRHRKEGPACSEVCPREAVVYGKVEDLKKIADARMKAAPKKYLNRIYGLTEAGGTQCLYLTAADVPFEKLGMPELTSDSVPALSTGIQHAIYQGFVAPAALYAVLGFVVWRNRRSEAKKEEHK